MELYDYFKSIADSDDAQIIICDLSHNIIYMNPAAIKNYARHGGAGLIGKSVLDCHSAHSREMIRNVAEWFAADKSHNKVHTFYSEKRNKDVYMVALRDGDGNLIGYYEKHEYRDRDLSPLYDLSD